MKIAVVGANSSTGRHLIEMGIDADHELTAVVRKPELFPLRDSKLTTIKADVLDRASVDEVVADQDAIVSILGAPYGREPVTVLSRGTANIIDAMSAHGVKRLVCVSSRLLAVGAPASSGEQPLAERFLFRKVLYPMFRRMRRMLYADMIRMEQLVRASDLDWTIVRPSALFNTEVLSDYHFDSPGSPGLYTSRIDLAHSLFVEATENSRIRTTTGVFTTQDVPRFRDIILKEVMHIGSWQAR